MFEPNRGQVGPDIRFLGRGENYSVAFSEIGVTFDARSGEPLVLQFPGAAASSSWEALDPLLSTSSYFIGNNSKYWLRNIGHSRRLLRKNIYPGIDLVFYGSGERIEYDFILSPGADPAKIRIGWRGADAALLTASGDLELRQGARTLLCGKPKIFEEHPNERRPVSGGFVLQSARGEARFSIGPHNAGLSLTIDPTIDAVAFLGGTGTDRVTASLGGLIAGVTDSEGLHGFGGRASGTDIFFWDGNSYTLLGGSGDDEPTSVAFSKNNFVLAGWTSSHDFPLTGRQSLQPNFGGGRTDGFILVNPNSNFGTSTYLGGSGDDRILAVSADFSRESLTNHDLGPYIVAGETTSTDFPVLLPLQAALAGGKDGFLTRVSSSGVIVESTYWGGSGDDSILALDTTASACWLAGRTNSTDLRTFNPLQAQSGGLSDAFLARLDLTSVPATVSFSTYYGGSGDDEITALKIGLDSWIWTGGNTTSPDLPLVLPTQKSLAGDTDVWLARFDPSRLTPSFVTYFGGSGHDQLTALAHDGNGELYAAGYTNSSDFPLLDPFQGQPGGGDDGFVARFDSAGQFQMSTFAGGAGNDRLRALSIDRQGTVSVFGETDSTSLAIMVTPSDLTKPVNAGKTDGMLVRFHQDGIYSAPLTLGENLTADFPVILAGQGNVGLPITVRSADPTRLTVNGGAFSTAEKFQLAALAADGMVDLLVSAPGLPPRHVPVTLRPSYFVNANAASVPVQISQSVYIDFPFATTNPATGELIFQMVRAGFDPGVTFLSKDTDVLSVQASYNASSQAVTANLRGLSSGTASVSIVSPSFAVRGPRELRVAVVPPGGAILKPLDIAVGQALETSLPLPLAPGSPFPSSPFQVTFTSEDPSRLLLSASPALMGSAVLNFQYSPTNSNAPSIWVQGRAASGTVRIRVDVAGNDPVYVNVALTPSIIGIATPTEALNAYTSVVYHNPENKNVSLNLWSTRTVFAVVAQIAGNAPPGFIVRAQLPGPESKTPFRLLSSDASVVALNGAISFDLSQGNSFALFTPVLTGVGLATLSVAADGYASAPPLQVTVLPRNLPLSVTDLTLGKGLQTLVRLDLVFDFPNDVKFTVTSSDPARVLVSSSQSDESASVSFRDGFYVSALAGTGDVPLTIQAPGFVPGTLLVHLAPLTFRLSPASTRNEIGEHPLVGIFWYYPGYVPSFAQTLLRANTTYTFTVTVADTSILQVESRNVILSGQFGNPTFTGLRAGTTTVSLQSTSAGAVVDPQFATAIVTVVPRTFAFQTATLVLGKDLQRLLPGFAYPANQGGFNLRSLDPTRVLLSKDPGLPGTATVSGIPNDLIYVQALAGSGDVAILASVPGYNDTSLTVRLVPTAIGFVDGLSNSAVRLGSVGSVLSLRVAPVAIDPVSGNPIPLARTSFRPDLDPFEVSLTSSNGAVGRLLSPIAFIGGLVENTTQFRADANGSTELSVVVPKGFADGGVALRKTVSISQPRLSIGGITLGKDMQYGYQVNVLGDVTGTSLPAFTVSSSDPSRLLVSNSPTAIGAASATVVRGSVFYAQALSAAGDVTVTVSAAGFDAASANVHLEPSYFSLNYGNSGQSPGTTVTYGTTFRTVVFLTHASSVNPSDKFLRPGVGRVTIPINSSNPSIVPAVPPIIFPEGTSQMFVTFFGANVGTATLSIDTPAGFGSAPEANRTYNVKVSLRNFDLRFLSVGKDRSASITLYFSPPLEQPVQVHLISGDPRLATLSTDPLVAGSAELLLNLIPGSNSKPVYVFGMADSGTTSVSLTGIGFEPATVTVELTPSGFIFPSVNETTIAKGKSATVQIATSNNQPVRGGAGPVTVAIVNSNPAVAHAAPAIFNPGMSSLALTLTADTPGVTLLTIVDNGGNTLLARMLITVTP